MCFSATASFVTAGVTGAIGLVSVQRARQPRQWPLAATPLVFALQQAVEGSLWLTLPSAPDGPLAAGLALVFLFVAQVFWPVYMPLMGLSIEPHGRRRPLMLLCLGLGFGVGAYLLWWILTEPVGAVLRDHHLVYEGAQPNSPALAVAYLAATALPLLLSSRRTVVVLGAIILAGSSVAYAFYWEAFVSVWCFFAAAASAVVLYHFERSRRRRGRIAPMRAGTY